jgi:hypothetical protein
LKGLLNVSPLFYEQGADYLRIGEYVRHWLKWVRSGLGGWIEVIAEIEIIKKHLHPSVFAECRCLCKETILILIS